MITRSKTFNVAQIMDHIRDLMLGCVPPQTKADIEFLESLNKLIEEQKQKQKLFDCCVRHKENEDDIRTT